MPKEGCWDLLTGTAILSSCSVSSHAQLPETFFSLSVEQTRAEFSVLHAKTLLKSHAKTFRFTTLPQHMGKTHQTSIALHCIAVL